MVMIVIASTVAVTMVVVIMFIIAMIVLVAMWIIAFGGGMLDLIYFCYLTRLFCCLVYIRVVLSEIQVDYLKVLLNIHLNKQKRTTKNIIRDDRKPADVEPVSAPRLRQPAWCYGINGALLTVA
jgi:polyferredoxin